MLSSSQPPGGVALFNLMVRLLLISVQELTKDLEAKSGLKMAVVSAGAQMVQLREDDDGDETPDSAQSSLQSQLTQVELDWSGLLADVPAVQTALQEVRTHP